MTESSPALPVVRADWGAPSPMVALTTTRLGGVSQAPFDALNLGDHVGDEPAAVRRNRALLQSALGLPGEPVWLDQVHGVSVVEVGADSAGLTPTADAAVTRERGCVLAIMTADCLPVVLASPEYGVMAAVHGGWRGLADDILQHTVTAMGCPASTLHAWLGPAIGPERFEVGDDVWDRFVSRDWQMARCFSATTNGKFMADLYAIARRSLTTLGIEQITGGQYCTYTDSARFYSYRRSALTGRMATLAWMQP